MTKATTNTTLNEFRNFRLLWEAQTAELVQNREQIGNNLY